MLLPDPQTEEALKKLDDLEKFKDEIKIALLMLKEDANRDNQERFIRAINTSCPCTWCVTKRKVIDWADERGLLDSDDDSIKSQVLKLGSEYGELADSVAKNGGEDCHDTIDAIGDMLVVMIILCDKMGISIESCLESAYNEIKDRKGKLVNGTFIKEGDSHE